MMQLLTPSDAPRANDPRRSSPTDEPLGRRHHLRPVLFVVVMLAFGATGSWLVAQKVLQPERINQATRDTADERHHAPVRVLGRDGGGDVITIGDTRTISMFFLNFQDFESIVLPAGADIDVSTLVISNGNLQTTEYAVGGLYIENAQQVPYVFYALDSFGTTAHNFDPPLPLRAGDAVVVVAASATTNVEWDITLHGRVPTTGQPRPSGVIAR